MVSSAFNLQKTELLYHSGCDCPPLPSTSTLSHSGPTPTTALAYIMSDSFRHLLLYRHCDLQVLRRLLIPKTHWTLDCLYPMAPYLHIHIRGLAAHPCLPNAR